MKFTKLAAVTAPALALALAATATAAPGRHYCGVRGTIERPLYVYASGVGCPLARIVASQWVAEGEPGRRQVHGEPGVGISFTIRGQDILVR